MEAASDGSKNWSRRVGVSGSVQLVAVEGGLAEVMSRLLTGGGGVVGVAGTSSTTTISGTS